MQSVLRKNNFSSLRSLLYAYVAYEERGKLTPELRGLHFKKIKALLEIDNEGVTNFMEKNANDIYLQSKLVKEDFERAKGELIHESVSTSGFGKQL